VCLAAVAVFAVQGFQGKLSRDLAIYAYAGEQVADGVPPYLGILNRAGPLAHLVPGVGAWSARLVGVDEVLGMRVLMMLLSIATVWVIYLFGRDVFGSRLAGSVAAIAMLTFGDFVSYATGGPREKTIMLLFLVLALWAVSKQRWVLAGGCVALAALSWQPVFLPGVLAALVGIAALRNGRAIVRALAGFAVGGLVPTVTCVVGFWIAGAYREFMDGFVWINAQYTQQPGAISWIGERLGDLQERLGWSLWLLLAGFLASIVLGVVRAPQAFRDRDPKAAAAVAVGAASVGGLLWCLRAFNGWPDAMVLEPMAALGIGGLAHLVLAKVPRRLGSSLVAAACVLLLVGAVAGSAATRNTGLQQQRQATNRILATGPDNPTIMSFGAAQPLVLTGRTNPSRHQSYRGGLERYVDDTYPGGLAGFADYVAEVRPTYLTFDDPEVYPWLADVLERDYTQVGNTFGWAWYVTRDVDPDVVKRLRETRKRLKQAAESAAAGSVK
jgi:hypothetical protein